LAQSVQTVVIFAPSSFPPLALGFFGLGTGFWLFYLMFAVVLDFAAKFTLQF
jgi:hypothetical protein